MRVSFIDVDVDDKDKSVVISTPCLRMKGTPNGCPRRPAHSEDFVRPGLGVESLGVIGFSSSLGLTPTPKKLGECCYCHVVSLESFLWGNCMKLPGSSHFTSSVARTLQQNICSGSSTLQILPTPPKTLNPKS